MFGLALRSPLSTSRRCAVLELQVEELSRGGSPPLNCEIECEGEGARTLSCDPDKNLITKVALYVLRCHGIHAFEVPTRVCIINSIPLSRGLGSSAAAVVAGVSLANEVGHLNLSKERMFDYCLMVERHPDNIGAACFGGFVGTFMKTLSPEDTARIEIPLSEVLPELSRGIDTCQLAIHEPPHTIGSYHQFRFNTDIKCVVVIPNFELNTAEARERLPGSYSREDAIFNSQRSVLLPVLLAESTPDPAKISEAMRDRLHQPYRADLIPGFAKVLTNIKHDGYPGLLAVCLSGAGPTILALATSNFEMIAKAIIAILSEAQEIHYDWQVLELDPDGATVESI